MRKFIDIVNELDHEIHISVEEKDIDGVDGIMLDIVGPASESENHITRAEAEALCDLLKNVLDPKEEIDESADSDAFRTWFGGSEVVDEAGNPLVVYHGGKSWRTAPGTTWFTDSPHIADGYADQGFSDAEIKPCFLRIERPLDLRDPEVAQDVFGDDFPDEPHISRRHKIRSWRDTIQHAIEYAQNYGYDGLIHEDSDVTNKGIHTSYVIFHPNQVKAAKFQGWEGEMIYGDHARFDDGNTGTYSRDDDDITR